MRYLFDTNIFIHYLRETAVFHQIQATYSPLKKGNFPFVSIATIGELQSISKQAGWGQKRMQKLEDLLREFVVVEIRYGSLIDKYADIDAFSQRKLPHLSPQPPSPRNMSKNDLWIAATASVLNARLLTTDRDFDHLDQVFLELIRVEVPIK